MTTTVLNLKERVNDLLSKGLTEEDIASFVMTTSRTVHRWKKQGIKRGINRGTYRKFCELEAREERARR